MAPAASSGRSAAIASTVCVLSGDPVGPEMAGPAIRAVELARVLSAAGHPVVLVAPVAGVVDLPAGVSVVAAESGERRALAATADVVVVFAGLAAECPWLAELDAMVVVDAYDPGLLETLERRRGEAVNAQRDWIGAAWAHLVEPLAVADAVLVASARQRHLVLGVLAALGRLSPRVLAEDPALDDLVRVVPFGVPATAPDAAGSRPLSDPDGLLPGSGFTALWGGGLYDWLDPLTLVEALARTRRTDIGAAFLAGPHPTPAVGRAPLVQRVEELARHHGLLGGRVALHRRWVPYAQRAAWLLDAQVGVSLHHHHLETELAFRTRVLDYLWAGLPVLCSAGDELADLVAAHDLGRVVPPDDPDAVAEALDALAGEGEVQRSARRARTAEVAARQAWPVVAAPLVALCATPRLAADRRAARPEPSRPRRALAALRGRTGPVGPRW